MSPAPPAALPPARSLLYVPGHRRDLHEKAIASAADAVIFDLEDGVPPASRAAAVVTVDETLGSAPRSRRLIVRIAADERGIGLLTALARPGALAEVVLAKFEAPEIAARARGILDAADSGATLAAVIETPGALAALAALANPAFVAGVARVQLGEADLSAALGIPAGLHRGEALLLARSQLVYASARLGMGSPTASTSTAISDPEALRSESEYLRGLGFFGRTCIHPHQIAIVNEVFTPTQEQVDAAHAVIDGGPADGEPWMAENGEMVDEAVARSARRVLASATAYGVR